MAPSLVELQPSRSCPTAASADGVPVQVVSQRIGHVDVGTTREFVGGFGKSVIRWTKTEGLNHGFSVDQIGPLSLSRTVKFKMPV
jgi:hypothetical protein